MKPTWLTKLRPGAFALACLGLLLVTAPLRADQFDSLRLYWQNQLTGTNNSASTLSSVANAANNNWSTMNTNATRTSLWSDQPFGSDSSHITGSFSRLKTMALAWATPGCSLYGNTDLAAAVTGGLDWMVANVYTVTAAEYDNWWDWEICGPQPFNDTALLMYPVLTGTQLANYKNAVDHFSPPTRGWSDGANLADKCKVIFIRSILNKDSAKMTYAQTNLSAVFPYVTSGDGFYRDGSFVYHSEFAYTGGYGRTLLGDVAQLVNLLQGSTWQITDPSLSNVFAWVTNSFEPVIYRGLMLSMVQGRGITSQGDQEKNEGAWAIKAMLPVAQFGSPEFAAALTNWAANPTPPPGHYAFPSMDRVVHVGTDYCLGLAMSSKRIGSYESILNANLHGWYTGDGMTYLYNGDLNQYVDNFWPTVNSYRLPGTTVDAGLVRADGSGQGYLSPNPWVGGASLGTCGAAGMQLKSYGGSLVANKSWFMFDDEIVCLGAGITSTDSRTIETVVENRQLAVNGGGNVFMVNGDLKPGTLGWSETMSQVNWAHLSGRAGGDDVGYYFPQPVTLKGLREARTGSWSDVQGNGSTTPFTRNYLTLWFDHGANPANATYAYVLLPNLSAWQVANYAAAPPITVLTNSSKVQAVQQTARGLTAANFWADGTSSIGGLTVDRKASVLVKNDGTWLEVALSDPTQTNAGSINLGLSTGASALLSADAGVTVTRLSPTIQMAVAVAGAAGQTFHARFYLPPATNITLNATADAYVYDGSPTSNYGTGPTMAVKKQTTGANRLAYLRFDLSSLPGGTPGAANLGLFCNYASLPGLHALATVSNNTWGETTVTWSNQPSASWGPDSVTWTPSSNAPVNLPVTYAVAAALNSGSNLLSFVIHGATQTTDGYVEYGTHENSTAANRPQLQMLYTHNPPTVVLTNPAADMVLSQPGPLTLGAAAASPEGSIVRVAFYDGGSLVGSATNAPYTCAISQLSAGNHQFYAVATDSLGLSATSPQVAVAVNGQPLVSGTNLVTSSGTPVDMDLALLSTNPRIPDQGLTFTVGEASNGTVALLADGHTARFTPAPGYYGPALFNYTASNVVEDARLFLHYNLQGHTADVSGNGRDGVLDIYGTGVVAYTNDLPGALAPWLAQSIRFTGDGTTGAVKLDRMLISTNELNFQSANWAVTGWCKRFNTNNWDMVFHLGTGSGSGASDLQLRFDGGANTLRLLNYNATGANDVNVSAAVNTGLWCHFAVVRNGGTLSLYVNGSLAGSDSGFSLTAAPAGPLSFGGNGTSSSNADRWLNGQLADLAVWTAPPTVFEIVRLATSTDVSHLVSGQGATATVSVQVTFQTSPTPVWNGGSLTDSNWSDAANWSGFTLQPGNLLFFDGTNRLSNVNDTDTNSLYAGVVFNAGAGAFVLQGNGITLSGGMTNKAAVPQTVSLGVNFGGGGFPNLTLDGGSAGLVLGGGLTNMAAPTNKAIVTLAGRGTLTNLLGSANGGTNTFTLLNGADWSLLDNGAGLPVTNPCVFSVTGGALTIGAAGSAPVFNALQNTTDNVMGTAPGLSTLTISNGAFTTPRRWYMPNSINATSVLNVVSGTFNCGSTFYGANGGGAGSRTNEAFILNASGGRLSLGSPLILAVRGAAYLNLRGTGLVQCSQLDLSWNAAGNSPWQGSAGTVNLDGGTLVTGQVTADLYNNGQTNTANGTAAIFNFNGGSLKASASSSAFFRGHKASAPIIPITAYVKAGGAIIDDGGYAIAVADPLLHAPELGATLDGGLVKQGSGTLTLAAPCTYTGETLVSAGTLLLNSSLGATAVQVATNATLSGNASLGGSVTVSPGGTLAPGSAGGVGSLNLASNLTLQGSVVMELNSAAQTNDVVSASAIAYGGLLSVTNLGGSLALTQSFRLFSAGSYTGDFAVLNLPALAGGLAWKWNAASGTLSVVTAVNPAATNITASVSGSTLTLNWPADHLGWRLQGQTNGLSKGLSTNWYEVPGASLTNRVDILINPANGAVFFRLVYP